MLRAHLPSKHYVSISITQTHVKGFLTLKTAISLYLSTYELQGTGEQAEELVKFKAFFLENDYDLPKEMPDYIPALLELCAVIDDEKAKEIYDYCKPKLEYIRERFIEAKLPYAFLFDIILSVANGLEDGAR